MSIVPINQIKGLKFPDEYVIKFFFKNKLHEKQGRVLELGCSNGNNLSIFYEYGWDVTGVDIDKNALAEAVRLFANGHFHLMNMLQYSAMATDSPYDVILMPSTLYYMDPVDIQKTLMYLKNNGWIKQGTLLYFRMRDLEDQRYRMGESIGKDTVLMTTNITGEKDCRIVFYAHQDFLTLLKKIVGFQGYKLFASKQTNSQNDEMILNSDFIVWGSCQ